MKGILGPKVVHEALGIVNLPHLEIRVSRLSLSLKLVAARKLLLVSNVN